jgi:hypothetical protein
MPVFQTGYEVGFSGEQAAAQSIAQIAASVDRYPAALGLQCHVDPFLIGGPIAGEVARWFDQTLAYATQVGLPIMAAEQWLRFIDARRASDLQELNWDNQRLSGTITIPSTRFDLTLCIPETHRTARLAAVTIGTDRMPHLQRQIAGKTYRVIRLTSGQHQVQATYT